MCKQAAWDDWPLTEQVAWAMGVEAASEEYDAHPIPAGGKCVDGEATKADWVFWLNQRSYGELPPVALNHGVEILWQAFRSGWQAQRSLLLREHIAKLMHGAMAYYCIDDGKIEDVIEWVTKRLHLDGWFVGAGE